MSFEGLYNHFYKNYDDFSFIVYGSLSILVIGFLISSLPFLLFQFVPSMNRYKIQGKMLTWRQQGWCVLAVTLSHTLIYVPAAVMGYHYVIKESNLGRDYESMPHWWQIAGRVVLCLVLEDTWHYFNHNLLHSKLMYGLIHKVHHTYQSPFPISAEYAHPIETMWLGLGFFLPTLIFTNHIFFFWCWLIARLVQTTDAHSGYFVPLNIFYLIPGYGGSPFHDFHHQNFTGNYGASFIWWDKILGTDREAMKLAVGKKEDTSKLNVDEPKLKLKDNKKLSSSRKIRK